MVNPVLCCIALGIAYLQEDRPMPPPDSEDWGLPEGAPDDAVDDDPNDSEVPSVHRQEQVPFGRSAAR